MAFGAVFGRDLEALDEVVRQRGVLRSAAMASSSLRRCPSALTPRSLRSSAVRLGRTVLPVTDVPIRAEPPARLRQDAALDQEHQNNICLTGWAVPEDAWPST